MESRLCRMAPEACAVGVCVGAPDLVASGVSYDNQQLLP